MKTIEAFSETPTAPEFEMLVRFYPAVPEGASLENRRARHEKNTAIRHFS